jgi:hypothetical protein
VVDYELIDDLPPPPTLRQRKDALITKIALAERDVLDKILSPPGKRRMEALKLNDIAGKKENEHTHEEKQLLAAFTAQQNRVKAMHHKAAALQSDVEDLTEETIESFTFELTEE